MLLFYDIYTWCNPLQSLDLTTGYRDAGDVFNTSNQSGAIVVCEVAMLSKANVSLTFMKAPDLIFLWSKSVINRTLFGPQTAEDVEIH